MAAFSLRQNEIGAAFRECLLQSGARPTIILWNWSSEGFARADTMITIDFFSLF
jgi:hypothetical protein